MEEKRIGPERQTARSALVIVASIPAILLSVGVCLESPRDDFLSPLMIALMICALIGTRVAVDFEGTLFWDGSFLPIACGVALLDPTSVATIILISEVAVCLKERYRPPLFLVNLCGISPN